MSNLLTETLIAIERSGHEVSDILYIGSEQGHSCTWPEFMQMANVSYDAGFGSAEVATDLRILFNDGIYMSRGEYDGSEWWDIMPPMEVPTELKSIKRVVGRYWPSLEELQNGTDDHHVIQGVTDE